MAAAQVYSLLADFSLISCFEGRKISLELTILDYVDIFFEFKGLVEENVVPHSLTADPRALLSVSDRTIDMN